MRLFLIFRISILLGCGLVGAAPTKRQLKLALRKQKKNKKKVKMAQYSFEFFIVFNYFDLPKLF